MISAAHIVVIEDDPVTRTALTGYLEGFGYRITGWTPDQRITMAANPDWWDKANASNVTEVVYTPIKADATRVAALLSGDVDMVTDLPTQDVARLRSDPKLKVVDGSETVIPADVVLLAFGFRPDPADWLIAQASERTPDQRLVVGQSGRLPFQSTQPKLFAGGDVVRGADLVVTAVADGRDAAVSIALFLGVTS